MNKITKFSISLGGFLALSTFLAPGVFAAGSTSYKQATVSWNSVGGAKYYNIYYKEAGAKKFDHAVRKLSGSSVSYTIGYLKKGLAYQYNLSALNDAGKEYWWSGVKPLK